MTMANNLKHVGRLTSNGRRVLVAFRTLPGESDSALVVQTETLTSEQHDALMKLVESPAGQSANEFSEAMARTRFPDGSVMLPWLHTNGRLSKVKTSDVDMVPSMQAKINLADLNQMIAEQRGISVNDLALGNSPAIPEVTVETFDDITTQAEAKEVLPPVIEQPLTDEDLAKKYRSDADRLSKEAAALRRMAEDLVPTKKKAKVEA
jgi:hypothetical protein